MARGRVHRVWFKNRGLPPVVVEAQRANPSTIIPSQGPSGTARSADRAPGRRALTRMPDATPGPGRAGTIGSLVPVAKMKLKNEAGERFRVYQATVRRNHDDLLKTVRFLILFLIKNKLLFIKALAKA